LEKQPWRAELRAPLEIRLFRKRKPSALGYMVRENLPLTEERRGLAISTYGKVIKRGWDWLGMTPSAPERVGGLIEVPQLASSLTLNKGDFIRVGARGAAYLAFRKELQKAIARQLAVWGDARESNEEAPPRELRPLQRDLAHVLEDLAVDFPLLASLVEHRAGGQKRLPLGKAGANGNVQAFITASLVDRVQEPTPEEEAEGGGLNGQANPPAAATESAPSTQPQPNEMLLPGKGGVRRPAHYGLDIQFEDRPAESELGRLLESTVWVNRAHPAYRRALVSHSIGYHIALSVAMALAPLAVEAANEHGFVTAFLCHWGEAIERTRANTRAKR
jgi:hypothetical protein